MMHHIFYEEQGAKTNLNLFIGPRLVITCTGWYGWYIQVFHINGTGHGPQGHKGMFMLDSQCGPYMSLDLNLTN